MKQVKSLIGVVALSLFSFGAQATFITGGFNMTNSGTGTVSINTTVDYVDFTNNSFVVSGPVSDDFTSLLTIGDAGSIVDFSYASPFVTVNPLFTVNSVSFIMTSVDVLFESQSGLSLRGMGTLSAAGFDNTSGEWSFSTQGGTSRVSWTATAVDAGSVPAPATLGLLSLGLLLMGVRKLGSDYRIEVKADVSWLGC